MPQTPMFEPMPCECYPDGEQCCCGINECALRNYAYSPEAPAPMTPEQREWCIGEAVWAGEGSYPRSETEGLPDLELARTVLRAWQDYVRSQL